jgi:alkanesulfonate monooxygenase SsuD/methylene tetrahydromethanopterin reductase-like flavin-dependent oxidoreductase (luciferase family)
LTRLAGVPDELMGEMGRIYRDEARFPTELVDDGLVAKVAVAGTPDECEAGIRALIAAGADEIVLFPMPAAEAERMIEDVSRVLLPRFGERSGGGSVPARG